MRTGYVRKTDLPPDKLPGGIGNPGRPKGARNRKILEAIEAVARIRASGTTPLEEMWKIAQTPLPRTTDARIRVLAKFKMMGAIAPYVHPKLAAMAVQVENATAQSHEATLELLDNMPELEEADEDELDQAMEIPAWMATTTFKTSKMGTTSRTTIGVSKRSWP